MEYRVRDAKEFEACPRVWYDITSWGRGNVGFSFYVSGQWVSGLHDVIKGNRSWSVEHDKIVRNGCWEDSGCQWLLIAMHVLELARLNGI